MQSRYYDPTVGRFLNADGIIGANGGIEGYNMFAYCNNNPVVFVDPTGKCYVQVESSAGFHMYDVACDCILNDEINTDSCSCITYIIDYVGSDEKILLYIHCSTRKAVHVDENIKNYFSGKNATNVDRRLLERLYIFGVENGIKSATISSAYRSYEDQQRLYNEYISGKRTSVVAKPGTSWHNYGGAVDISSSSFRNCTNEQFKKYGLIRPVKTENWHFQIIETTGMSATKDGETYFDTIIKWSD